MRALQQGIYLLVNLTKSAKVNRRAAGNCIAKRLRRYVAGKIF